MGFVKLLCPQELSNRVAGNVEYLRRQGIHCSSAWYKCPIENIKLKLTTKSQIYKCQPEPLLIVAHS